MIFQTSPPLVTVTTLLLSCFLPQASAFWRLPCHNPVTIERADPIINPGQVSGHLHTIMGGNGFDFSMDFAKARTSTCSSCTVKQDLSNYWIPSLFYAAKNGTFHPVQQNGGALIYYLQRRATDNEKLYAFPENFRMLAGDPFLRSYSDTLEQKAISYACLGVNGPETNSFPDKNCPGGLRLQVFFPSCWNGKDLDSPDHKSHMAYPDGVNSGKCPPTHPKRFISIFYEVLYRVDDFKSQWYNIKQPFVLSNGDPTGFGLHGDFVNGWDIKVLQQAIDDCTDESGVVEVCPYFTFFPDQVTNDCFIPPRISEPIDGWMDKLPGCNPVQKGPERAVSSSGCGTTTAIGPAKTYFTDMSSKGWSYVGCATDDLNNRTFPIRTSSDSMTIEKCIDYCVKNGNDYAGLEYGQECYCSTSLPAADRLVSAKCIQPCAGNSDQICGDAQRLSVYKKGGAVASPARSRATAPATTNTPILMPSSIVKSTTLATVLVSSISTPVASSTKTSTTSSIQIPTRTKTSTPSFAPPLSWTSKGCWVDPVNPRALKTVGYLQGKTTTSGCIKHCDSDGFKYAGTENSGQCFCSNSLDGGKAAPDPECSMPCDGNASETCGGSARLSLFQKTGAKKESIDRRNFRHHHNHI